MWLMFQATFSLGSYPMDWIEAGVEALGSWVAGIMPEGPLNDLLVNGVIAGVGGVIVFLPNILIFFFFISLMEDTGYMARAAFIMDRMMHKIGLHGKSFIPLLIGFGCNVPAIMATRTLESRRDRIMTMLITPFMSCSARLPVYILLVSAFFPVNQGLILLSVYLIGILLAIGTSFLLKKTLRQIFGSFCHGIASLPDAYDAKYHDPYVGKSRTIFKENGYDNLICFYSDLGTGVFPFKPDDYGR